MRDEGLTNTKNLDTNNLVIKKAKKNYLSLALVGFIFILALFFGIKIFLEVRNQAQRTPEAYLIEPPSHRQRKGQPLAQASDLKEEDVSKWLKFFKEKQREIISSFSFKKAPVKPSLQPASQPSPSPIQKAPPLTNSPSPLASPPASVSPVLTTCPLNSQGDANCDNQIDQADYLLWENEFRGILATKKADFNQDGQVSLLDYRLWLTHKQ